MDGSLAARIDTLGPLDPTYWTIMLHCATHALEALRAVLYSQLIFWSNKSPALCLLIDRWVLTKSTSGTILME
jgi:hypothetical protein